MNISRDVNSIFSPRVKMPSGGYLIFEQTEAMYVVDVNSGRYAAKKAQEDNSLKTNLEAAREIAKQLRLRDIGGIIVVDFIDLQQDSNRKKVYDEIRREFKKDRAKTNILPMSDFGVMQITRQRIRPSVVKSVSKVCPMCGGSGSIVSESTLLSDLEAWISKFRHNYSYRSIDLYVNPFFHSVLCQGLISTRLKWMFKYMMRIKIENDASISLNDFKVTLRGSEFDIAETVNNGESIEEAIALNQKRMAEMESGGRRRPEMLDFYDKKSDKKDEASSARGNGKRESSSAGRKDDSSESGSSRKRPVPARISSNPRSNNKIKSKYFKKSEEENKADSKEAKAEPAPGPKPAAEKPKKEKSAQSNGNGSAPASDKPAALEVAKEYYYSEKPPQEKEKPAALEIAKAYAEEMKQEQQKNQSSEQPAASGQKSEAETSASKPEAKEEAQPQADSATPQKEENQKPEEQKKAAVPASETSQDDKASEKHQAKADSAEEPAKQLENKHTSETAEEAEESRQKTKGAKRVKRAAPARRKKAVANPSRAKESKKSDPAADASDAAPEKAGQAEDAESKPDPKAEKLREMDAVKATLNEDIFRKPASAPGAPQQKKSRSAAAKKDQPAPAPAADESPKTDAPAPESASSDAPAEKKTTISTSVLKTSAKSSESDSEGKADKAASASKTSRLSPANAAKKTSGKAAPEQKDDSGDKTDDTQKAD
jgi:hypothetical protein